MSGMTGLCICTPTGLALINDMRQAAVPQQCEKYPLVIPSVGPAAPPTSWAHHTSSPGL